MSVEMAALSKRPRSRKMKNRRANKQAFAVPKIKRIVSIPSRFETVLKKSSDELHGFGSTSHRFNGKARGKLDPGQFLKIDSAERKSPSYSAKGFGSGFISRTHRFKSFEYSSDHLCGQCEEGLHPIHGSTFNDKHSRSTSFSKSRHASHSAYFSQQMKAKAHTPGPGSYSHRMPRLSGGVRRPRRHSLRIRSDISIPYSRKYSTRKSRTSRMVILCSGSLSKQTTKKIRRPRGRQRSIRPKLALCLAMDITARRYSAYCSSNLSIRIVAGSIRCNQSRPLYRRYRRTRLHSPMFLVRGSTLMRDRFTALRSMRRPTLDAPDR